MTLMPQARLAFIREDFRLARELNQRVLDLKRGASFSAFTEATIQAWLAEAALKQGDKEAARASYAESLVNFELLGNGDAATTIRTMLADLDARAFEQSRATMPGADGA
jgi:hypothetical protein